MDRDDAVKQLWRARAEYDAAAFALRHVAATLRTDAALERAARVVPATEADFRRATDRLEITFVLRLFAEFEGLLRDYWATGLGKTTRPDMRPLMNAIARRRQMNDADLDLAHKVREYRNGITHAGVRGGELDLNGCGNALCRYLRWLPHQR